MRIISAILLIVSCFLVSGCSVTDSGENKLVTVEPEEVRVVEKTSQAVQFNMVKNCASYCLKNFMEQIERKGNTYQITTLAKSTVSENGACPDACQHVERTYSVNVQETGTITFQFLHLGQVSKEITLTF